MTNYARIEHHEAFLFTQFGEDYARRLFGNTVVDTLPRYTRGKHKGTIKGRLDWRVCTHGGWVRSAGGGGHVQYKGLVSATLVETVWDKDDKVLHSLTRQE